MYRPELALDRDKELLDPVTMLSLPGMEKYLTLLILLMLLMLPLLLQETGLTPVSSDLLSYPAPLLARYK